MFFFLFVYTYLECCKCKYAGARHFILYPLFFFAFLFLFIVSIGFVRHCGKNRKECNLIVMIDMCVKICFDLI